jgi:hypothetical protein
MEGEFPMNSQIQMKYAFLVDDVKTRMDKVHKVWQVKHDVPHLSSRH